MNAAVLFCNYLLHMCSHPILKSETETVSICRYRIGCKAVLKLQQKVIVQLKLAHQNLLSKTIPPRIHSLSSLLWRLD